MRMIKTKFDFYIAAFWAVCFLLQSVGIFGQAAEPITSSGTLPGDLKGIHSALLKESRGSETSQLLRPIFGTETEAAIAVLDEDTADLIDEVNSAMLIEVETEDKAEIEKIRESIRNGSPQKPETDLPKKPSVRGRKSGYFFEPTIDWRRLAFGFQPVSNSLGNDVKVSKKAGEISSEGERKKTFETDKAVMTRTQKAETKFIKDGKTFGVEMRTSEVIEGRSKIDDSTFRKVTEIMWKASVAACPAANGGENGVGGANMRSETAVTGKAGTANMSRTVSITSKSLGNVNDEAEMAEYDLIADSTETITGYDEATRRGLLSDVMLKDGIVKLRYELAGNKLEMNNSENGEGRTPAKMGKPVVKKVPGTSDEAVKSADKTAGALVAGIWNYTNDMYKAARSNWRHYRCVTIDARAPKTRLKKGESVTITAETVHRLDGSKVNARLEAGALDAEITPEVELGKPRVSYRYTNGNEMTSDFTVESISKRGIGIGGITFITETECAGGYTGTIEITKKRSETETKVTTKGQHTSDQFYSGTDTHKWNFDYSATVNITDSDVSRHEDGSVSVSLRGLVTANAARIAEEKSDWVTQTDCFPDPPRRAGQNAFSLMEERGDLRGMAADGMLTLDAGNYRLNFSIPEIEGTNTHRQVVKPFGWCMPEQNPPSDTTTKDPMSFSSESISIEESFDPLQQAIIEGTRTFEDDMGFQVTVKWSLRKCG